MNVTADQLKQISPLIPADSAVTDLNAILTAAQCTSVQRAAMLIGQLAIESDYFRTRSEDPTSYAGKPYVPFYGRCWIQLTWKYNYHACGVAIGVDLETDPDAALQHNVDVCNWYWTSKRLNRFADDNDCDGCTRAINGQHATDASLQLREKYYKRALAALQGSDPDFSDVVGGSSSV